MTDAPDTLFVTGETFEQLLPREVLVTPAGGTQTTLSNALAAAAGGTVTSVTVADGPFLTGVVITKAGTITSSVNPTQNGILLGNGTAAVGTTNAMTGGQLLVGQTSAAPLPRTISGDLTIDNTGAAALEPTGVTAATYGDSTHVAQIDVDAAGRILTAASVAIAALTGGKLTGVFTANGTLGTLPANAMLIGVTLLETAGQAVDVSLGSTSGGAEVMDAVTVGASSILSAPASSLNLLAFTSSQAIFVASAAWNSASITATAWYLS